jgi:hypothetical protein
MTCSRQRISAYLDGDLGPGEAEQLEQHLADCTACREDLDRYRALFDSLDELREVQAPSELRRELYRRVEERARARRSLSRGVLLPAVALTGATVLLCGAVAYAQLRPRESPPLMTAAFVVQETPESLDGLRLQLVFDRPIAADSLEAALRFEPPLEVAQRVRDNKVELMPQAPLPAEASYRLTVANVRDQRGNVQEQPVVLSLIVGPASLLVQESSPLPTPVQALASGESSLQSVSARASSPLNPLQWLRASGSEPGPLETSAELQRVVGLPRTPPRAVQLVEQAFQGGAMLARLDTRQVYALDRASSRWAIYASGWRPGEVLAPIGPERPPGTWEPMGAIGKAWREQPAIRNQLGWAVFEERSAPGLSQIGERGSVLRSATGLLYLLLDDGTWRTLPDPGR